MPRLKDKVALLTGACGGQGVAEAHLFAEEGAAGFRAGASVLISFKASVPPSIKRRRRSRFVGLGAGIDDPRFFRDQFAHRFLVDRRAVLHDKIFEGIVAKHHDAPRTTFGMMEYHVDRAV